MAKRPSFQFYPGDWLRDTALRSCSMQARSLWIDMLCYMTDTEPYGYLKVGNKVILPVNLAPMVGLTILDCETLLQELREAGIFSEDEQKCIFSRRMVKDEETRKKRAEGGILGGNPALKVKKNKPLKVNLNHNLKDNLSIEDEEEVKDEEEKESFERGVGKTFEIPEPTEREKGITETAKHLISCFGWNEIRDFAKMSEARMFLVYLDDNGSMEWFVEQFNNYFEYKKLSKENSHNLTSFIGTPAKAYQNGGWNAAVWSEKLKNYQFNGKSTRQQKPDISNLANLTDQILNNAGINIGGANSKE